MEFDMTNEMTDAITDGDLMNAAKKGDNRAFEELVKRHAEAVYRFAYRYVRTASDAEDIAQESFLRALRNVKKFDESKNFKTWLFTIAKNAAIDSIKKKKPFLFSYLAPEDADLDSFFKEVDGAAMVEAEVDGKFRRANIARFIDSLPADYKRIISMRYDGMLKFREIAKVLGESVNTVKSRHRRGLTMLRKLMSEPIAQ